MVAMAVPLWVAPTVGSAPRLPTRVKFNIGHVLSSGRTPERWEREEQLWLAEPASGSYRSPARSRAAHTSAAATHAGSRSDAQTTRPSLAARAAVVPRPTNGSATTSPGKLNRVTHRSGSGSGNGAGHSGSDVPGNRHSPRGPHSSNHASCGMDAGPERLDWRGDVRGAGGVDAAAVGAGASLNLVPDQPGAEVPADRTCDLEHVGRH